MKFLESVIYKYYDYSDVILYFWSVVFGVGAILGFLLVNENRRYVLNKLLHRVFYVVVVVCVGFMFYILGLTPEIEYVHFNMMFFVISTMMVIIYGIFQSIIFTKIQVPAFQLCKNIEYIIYVELFLLTIVNHLDVLEWVTGILAILCIELLFFMGNRYSNKKLGVVSKESDYPNPDLFYIREKQLKKFISVLDQQKKEPYAIMISGEWGQGKTSFVRALEQRLKEDVFIWIQAGSEKSASEIMSEIAEQILEVLRVNNVLVEKEGLIEKYFIAFSRVLEETGVKFFGQVADVLGHSKCGNSKEYLNSKLQDLNKTIYLVIDDLDRCSKEYQEKAFKIIRESTELTHCKTIFLVDRAQFLDCDVNYIEKYISYTLELCRVDSKEILNYLVNDIIEDEFIEQMDSVLLKDRSAEDIKGMICQFPDNILNDCEIELSKVASSIKNKKVENAEQKGEEEKVVDITQTVFEIKKNITNTRKIKRYLKGIKTNIDHLNIGIEECSAEFQRQDWLQAIIEVQFLKNILPELYTDIKMSNDIIEFWKKYKGYSAGIVLGMRYGFWLQNEIKEKMLNHIIYDIDVIDFMQVTTDGERCLAELYSDNAEIKNVNEYLEYAKTYADIIKILELCERQRFDNYEDRENFIKTILNIMSRQSIGFKVDNKVFYEVSKTLIDYLKRLDLSEKEKSTCVHEGYMITRRVIVDNAYLLRNILLLLFRVDEVEKAWQTLSVTDINEFYTMLQRIDNNLTCQEDKVESEKLLIVRRYYEKLVQEIKADKYKDVGLDFSVVSSQINIIFDILKLWLDIEVSLNEGDENMPLINMYFHLEGAYSSKAFVFENISNLKNALNVLKVFYESKVDCYKTEFSLLFLRVSHQVISKYELDKDWFEGQEYEVGLSLKQILNIVCELDQEDDFYSKIARDEMKILVYKLCSYCKEA